MRSGEVTFIHGIFVRCGEPPDPVYYFLCVFRLPQGAQKSAEDSLYPPRGEAKRATSSF